MGKMKDILDIRGLTIQKVKDVNDKRVWSHMATVYLIEPE